MKQVTRHYCKCGEESVARKKSTGEWLCMMCVVRDICIRRGIETVYLAPMDDDTLDFFVPLVDLLPIHTCWN